MAIHFTYDDVPYTLEYTRNTIRQMERRGFIAKDVQDKPATGIPDLFAGAFLAHHKYLKREKIDEIYNNLKDRSTLVTKLVDLYNEPILSLIEDEEGQGNVDWTVD